MEGEGSQEIFDKASTYVQHIIFCFEYMLIACNHTLQTQGFKTLMNYPKDFRFDIILFDMSIGECLLPLIQKFNYPPAVGLSAYLLPAYLSYDFGNDLHPSYVPTYYTPYSSDMTFVQRLENFVLIYTNIFIRDFITHWSQNRMMLKAFGDDMDSVSNLRNHVSLLLSNLDPVINHPEGLTPNIIPVGGLHIRPKKLPKVSMLLTTFSKFEYPT